MRRLDATCVRDSWLAAATSLRAAITLVLIGLLSTTAHAVTTNWTNNNGGSFITSGNWDNGVPGSDDLAVFRRGNVPQYDVSFFSPIPFPLGSPIHPTVNRLIVGTNTVNLLFPLLASTLTVDQFIGGGDTIIGQTASDVAVLNMNLASLSTLNATLASAAGSSGTLNLNGARTFNVTGTGAIYDLIVGASGTGAINVSTGADVTVADDTVLGQNATGVGNVSVSGAGSTWISSGDLRVGESGGGALTITAAAQVSDATGYVGASAGSIGTASISGAGSSWTNSIALIVGYFGNGTLDITSGGQATSSVSGYVGYFADAIGSATVSGASSSWNNSLSTIVGSSGTGSLTVSAGGLVSDTFGVLGSVASSHGTATITGANSRWNNTSNLFVGDAGNGTLAINSGGAVSNTIGYVGDDVGAIGAVTVDGIGSSWTNAGDLYVGKAGSGTLDITAGGVVSNAAGYFGNQAGSMGEVTVNGAGSFWSNRGDLYVGNGGTGTLNITNGGQVENSDAFIGYLAGSTGAVVVDGVNGSARSKWRNNLVLQIGGSGSGTLQVTRGAEVRSNECLIGGVVGTDGTVTVDGATELFLSELIVRGDLSVGTTGGSGALHITNGGHVEMMPVEEPFIGLFSETNIGSEGLVTVTGGSILTTPGLFTLAAQGELHISNNGAVEVPYYHGLVYDAPGISYVEGSVIVEGGGFFGSESELDVGRTGNTGSLQINTGGRVGSGLATIGLFGVGTVTVDGAGSIWSSGSIQVAVNGIGMLSITNGGTVATTNNLLVGVLGEINGDGNIAGILENGGLVSPGVSPGALNIDGNYTQTNAGELLIELASSSSYDQLLVTGTATLAGTLTVNLIDGFTPSIGQSFTILTADDVDGQFDTEPPPTASNFGFDLIYNPQSVVLTVFSALPGDYNGNGAVDAADYVVWRKNVGAATLNNRDPNGMGAVGQADYDFWRMHFGQSAGSGAAAGATGSASAAAPEPTSLVLLALAGLGGLVLRRGGSRGSWGVSSSIQSHYNSKHAQDQRVLRNHH
jgi:T5SS/PEP-CTERM-associated repeat protein